MNKEVISAENADRLTDIGAQLANIYKGAFAGEPWFEVSKCVNLECRTDFSSSQPNCACNECLEPLAEAYDTEELIAGWLTQLRTENAMLEVAFDGPYPQRATLARPTTPEELAVRKYSGVPAMWPVLATVLPVELVWIEDTFADRRRVPQGNLRERGATLDRIASFYGEPLTIATRTLAKGIVRATLRDKLATTAVYMGTERAGQAIVNEAFGNPGYSLPAIPDKRTLLVIGGRS